MSRFRYTHHTHIGVHHRITERELAICSSRCKRFSCKITPQTRGVRNYPLSTFTQTKNLSFWDQLYVCLFVEQSRWWYDLVYANDRSKLTEQTKHKTLVFVREHLLSLSCFTTKRIAKIGDFRVVQFKRYIHYNVQYSKKSLPSLPTGHWNRDSPNTKYSLINSINLPKLVLWWTAIDFWKSATLVRPNIWRIPLKELYMKVTCGCPCIPFLVYSSGLPNHRQIRHHSRGVCRSTPTTPGRQGNLVSQFNSWRSLAPVSG